MRAGPRWTTARYRAAGVPEEVLDRIAFSWEDLERLDPARAAAEISWKGSGGRGGPFGWGPVYLNLPIGGVPTAEKKYGV
jgi:hypothetical protein